jgi:hypothetical protein
MIRVLLVIGLMVISLSINAYAVPAFARQMGVSCVTCHSQNGFPALNAYGAKFKAGGYTTIRLQKTVEEGKSGAFLSLPETLNASFVAKISYLKSDATEAALEFPDGASLILGGRVGEHVGSFVEIEYEADEDKVFLSNFKLPIAYDIRGYTLGVVPFRTDGSGPSFTFETLSTGADSHQIVLEESEVISAQQYIGAAHEAEGLGLYLYTPLWNVVYSAWVPKINEVRDFEPAHYLRAAVTPKVGGWELGFGAQVWTGTAKYADENASAPRVEAKTDAYAVDFQAMGSINALPLSFFATYAVAQNDQDSIFNTGADDKYAATLLAEAGVLPGELMLSAGYRNADKGTKNDASDDAAILGVKYFLLQNVEFQLDYTYMIDDSNDRNHLLAMLYAAF